MNQTASRRRAAIIVALAGAVALEVVRYRRKRRRLALDALRSIAAPRHPAHGHESDGPSATTAGHGTHEILDDPAHAPGHRHLPPPPAMARAKRAPKGTPRWAPRADRVGHPGRFG